MSLLLLGLFAAVTMYQFNQVNADRLYDAQLNNYENELQIFRNTLESHEVCVASVKTRETYRSIFAGIETMFQKTADLPVSIFPDSEAMRAYQASLSTEIILLITDKVAAGLPPLNVSECPPKPTESEKPVRP